MSRSTPLLIGLFAVLALVASGCEDPPALERAEVARVHRDTALQALDAGNHGLALAAAEQAVAYEASNPAHLDLVNRVKLDAVATSARQLTIQDTESLAYLADFMAERDPHNKHVYLTAEGHLKMLQGDERASEACFVEAEEAVAGYWPAVQGRSLLLVRRGDYDNAITLLEAAVQENAKRVSLLRLLGNTLVKAGRPDQGVEILERVVSLAPISESHLDLARALTASGHQQIAGAEFQRAVVKGPESVGAHFAFATWLVEAGQIDSAAEHFDAVTQLGHPHLGRFGKGLIQIERKEYKLALGSFQHVLQLRPQMSIVKYHAAVAHEKLGNPEPARALYEAYIAEAAALGEGDETLKSAREKLALLVQNHFSKPQRPSVPLTGVP